MKMVQLIQNKRDGKTLSKEEIHWMIEGYVQGIIPDYQMAALAMAIYYQGMNPQEISELTLAMAQSGDQVSLNLPGKVFVDKHSSGGVGDKTTLIVGPMVAACGVPVAKMSGRGLGHTGGTIDKLSAIPGFQVEMTQEAFWEQVKRIDIAIIAQSGNLVPADKKLYALRDVTATVDIISLIASSIMSKKIASGAQGIVLDVKYGSGAFMATLDKAELLAETMVEIGNSLGRETLAILSNMNQPLGKAVGNSLEILEAIETLQGNGPQDLMEVCYEIGIWMLIIGQRAKTREEAYELLKEALHQGAAFAKFLEFIEAQGGEADAIINKSLPLASLQSVVKAKQEGYIHQLDAQLIGVGAMNLGAGRETKESKIDLGAGIYLNKQYGDFVKKGEPILTLYASEQNKLQRVHSTIEEGIIIKSQPAENKPLIAKVVRQNT